MQFGAGAGPEQFLAAQRLGFDPSDLVQGRLNQREILSQAIAGVQGLPDVEARLRLEQAGFSEDVRAAILVGSREGLSAAVAYQQRQAVLSEEQLAANRDMGRNIDEILSQIGRLVQIALSGIAPPLLSMSSAILKWLSGPEGALRAEQQELGFARGELENRRAGDLEEYRRAAALNPFDAALPEAAPLQAADRALAGIERRLAEIPAELAHLRDIDLSGQFPGPLGHTPGAEFLAERDVSAGDLFRYVIDPSAALRDHVPGADDVLSGRLPDVNLGVDLPFLPNLGVDVPFLPNLGVDVPNFPGLNLLAPDLPNLGVDVPFLPNLGVDVPNFPGLNLLAPDLPNLGVDVPFLPNLGVDVPNFPGLNLLAPDLPNLGVDVPFLPNLGVDVPRLSNLGVGVPSPSALRATPPQQPDGDQLKNAFAQALREAGFGGAQATTYYQDITNNFNDASGADIAQRVIDAQAGNPAG